MSNFRRRLMGVQQHGGLPAGYQEVEYIESTGTQYIDTGIIGNSNIGIKAVCSLSEIYSYESKNSPGYFFGVCSDGDTRFTSVISGSQRQFK